MLMLKINSRMVSLVRAYSKDLAMRKFIKEAADPSLIHYVPEIDFDGIEFTTSKIIKYDGNQKGTAKECVEQIIYYKKYQNFEIDFDIIDFKQCIHEVLISDMDLDLGIAACEQIVKDKIPTNAPFKTNHKFTTQHMPGKVILAVVDGWNFSQTRMNEDTTFDNTADFAG